MSYNTHFLGDDYLVTVPKLSDIDLKTFAENDLDVESFYLDYQNFSLLHNPIRKFPYFTIANIDGGKFISIKRKDAWAKDKRIPSAFQFGSELYSAEKSDFDKGHMTKREDVQWGSDEEEAKEAALSTFYYTNAVPQVDKLNRGIWSKIEKYILHSESVKRKQRITMVTGPVLSEKDPEFVTLVKGQQLKIPVYFWKIVYYLSREDALCYTAFIVSQLEILEERRIIKPKVRGIDEERFFMTFKAAETYQTRVDLIEELSGLKFHNAKEIYFDERPTKLVLERTEIRSGENIDNENIGIKNIIL